MRLVATTACLVAACARATPGAPPADDASAAALTDRRWTLVALDGRPAVAGLGGEAPYLRLRADTTRVEGSTGCNTLFGRYEHAGDGLRFDALGSTRRACADSAPADQEQRFMTALGTIRRYTVRGDTLTLLDDGAVRARLTATRR